MTVIQFQTSCLQLVFTSGIPCNSERDRSVRMDSLHTLLCRSIRLRLLTLFFCFCSIMKQQQKLLCKFIFHKKENGNWIWKAWRCLNVVQSFNIIVWPTPCLKWPNLKCHVGHMTHFDQFLDWTLLGFFLLSNLCTDWNIIVLKYCCYIGLSRSSKLSVSANCHIYVWIFFLFSCSTACLVLSEVLLLEYFVLEFSLGELMQGYPLLLCFSLCNPKSSYWQFTPLSQNDSQLCVFFLCFNRKSRHFLRSLS